MNALAAMFTTLVEGVVLLAIVVLLTPLGWLGLLALALVIKAARG